MTAILPATGRPRAASTRRRSEALPQSRPFVHLAFADGPYRPAVTSNPGTAPWNGQIMSASMVALAHGTNDAQKTMGTITSR